MTDETNQVDQPNQFNRSRKNFTRFSIHTHTNASLQQKSCDALVEKFRQILSNTLSLVQFFNVNGFVPSVYHFSTLQCVMMHHIERKI